MRRRREPSSSSSDAEMQLEEDLGLAFQERQWEIEVQRCIFWARQARGVYPPPPPPSPPHPFPPHLPRSSSS